jgi:glycosyltransferase involved in cell wall biosynthesis
MTERPLVSVIINCYNGEKYLREAIDSVIAQTYENWELVFWDNQSTDSTREIVESYNNPKIKYFYAPEHTPLGEARNLAVEKSRGEYINFLDADDVWMPEKLQKQVEKIVPGKVETVITGYDIIADDKAKKLALYAAFEYNKDRNTKDIFKLDDFLLDGSIVVFSSVLFNKKIYLEVGGIDPEFEQNEDFDIIVKSATKSDIGYVRGNYTKYRIHGGNNSTVNGVLGYLENRKIYDKLPNTPALKKAKEINETRIAAYNIAETKSIKNFFTDVLFKGRLLIFCKLLFEKIKRRIIVNIHK